MIGSLRHRVTFQKLQRVPNGQGGFSHTWSDYTTVWAKVQSVPGKEKIEADRLVSVADFKVIIRYRDDIDETMRLVWKGRKFQILSIAPDEKGRYITMFVRGAHDEGVF